MTPAGSRSSVPIAQDMLRAASLLAEHQREVPACWATHSAPAN
jgi:hypothetical protein